MNRGTVLAYNPENQRIAVAVEGDSCAVFELTGELRVEVGNKLRGELESGLCFVLENLTTGKVMSVIPQGVHLTFNEARRSLDL